MQLMPIDNFDTVETFNEINCAFNIFKTSKILVGKRSNLTEIKAKSFFSTDVLFAIDNFDTIKIINKIIGAVDTEP